MKARLILPLVVFLGIACLLNYTASYAQALQFKSYQASYIVKYDGIPFGRSITDLKILPSQQYELCITNITTVPFLRGQVKECSSGSFKKDVVQPSQYTYFYQDSHGKQQLQIDFNWQKLQAVTTVNGSSWRMAIPANTQDKMSYQLALRLGLAKQQQEFSFPVADGGKLKYYEFTVVDKETITTPLQTFDTIKLARAPIPGKENVILWFSPDLNYSVVRAQQTKHIVDIGTAEITHLQE